MGRSERRVWSVVTAVVMTAMGGIVVPPASAAADCRSLPAPAADLLRAVEARTQWGADGSGVTVGVISDSFDTSGSAADDVVDGLLPGPGNPCGWTTPVRVVRESASPDSDEGRAMAQLVHGVAPGAELMFASPNGDTEADLADAIDLLREQGADIIVDDKGTSDSQAFHRTASGDAVQRAVDAGVVVVAAAGNYGVIGGAGYPSSGYPIGGWASTEYRPTACPAEVSARAGVPVDCMDFDPGPGVDPVLDAVLAPGALSEYSFDWAEPNGAVATRLGLDVTEPLGAGLLWAPDPQVPHIGAGGIANLSPDPAPLRLSFVRQRDAADTRPAVSFVLKTPGPPEPLVDLEYFTSTGTDTVGTTLIGHSADPATLAVAAADAQTLTLQTYSSAGPARTLFGLPAPAEVTGPAVTGLDALPTSVAGLESFQGTSAAAPTVAAVAALVRQTSPELSPARIREVLTSTARPEALGSPWLGTTDASRFQGAGLVDAFAAVQAVRPAPAVPPADPPAPDPRPARLADSGGADVLPVTTIAVIALLTGVALLRPSARHRVQRTAWRRD